MIDFAEIGKFLDQIITHDGKMLDRHIVIRPDDFQMSWISPRKIFRFEIFLLIDEIPVPRSELAVHMVTPAEGIFVLYELKDMKVPWKEINGCRIRTFDPRGNVEVDTTLKFYGLRRQPKRCVLMENDNLSRAIVAWRTRQPTEEEIRAENQRAAQKAEAAKVVEEESDDVGITILPPASPQEMSLVSDILARLLGKEDGGEDLDPVLPS